jgi:hypothetical protein
MHWRQFSRPEVCCPWYFESAVEKAGGYRNGVDRIARRADSTIRHGVPDPDGVEVAFVTASGKTEAVLTLTEHDVRSVDQNDLITVRPLSHTA